MDLDSRLGIQSVADGCDEGVVDCTVCSGSVVVTAYDFESGRPGSSPTAYDFESGRPSSSPE